MSDNVIPILSAQERLEIFKIIHDIKASSKELADRSRPMFNGTRYLSDTEVAKRLSVSKTTLANYRMKGILGYYSLEGKIVYSEDEIEDYLRRNYHPPYK
ncbi:MAG: helix-turn-helix domain-containing protein [Muribaculaceae bacterium]